MASAEKSKKPAKTEEDSGSDFSDDDGAIPLRADQASNGKSSTTAEAGTRESKKRKKSDADEEDTVEADDDADEQNGVDESGEIIPVSFEYFDPKPTDHYAVKGMLAQYLDTEDWKADGLAKLLCDQEEVGAMVKAEEEDQPYAFITALPVHAQKDNDAIKRIKKYMIAKADDKSKAKLTELLNDEKRPLGLLIHERIINLPEELVPPLHDALAKDLEFVKTNTAVEKKVRDSFQFENFVLMTKCFKATQGAVVGQGQGKGKQKKKKQKVDPATAPLVYLHFEDEFYRDESFLSFAFPGEVKEATKEQVTRVIMAFSASKLPKVVSKLVGMMPSDIPMGMGEPQQGQSQSSSSSSSDSGKKGKK